MRTALVGVAALALVACGGARTTVPRVADAERTKSTLAAKDVKKLAPDAMALAESELALAHQAESKGDTVAAELHAERAVAAYADAVAIARLAHATEDEASAKQALDRASELATRYTSQRKATDREADDLEKQLRVAREAQLPPASGAADPDRERARVIAAQSLVTQARLLCSAARLVNANAPGIAEAESAVAGLEKQGARDASLAIDSAARARAACLASLTKARRAASAEPDQMDALLAELSTSGVAGDKDKIDKSPTRDERGVVVTLRGIWSGTTLTSDGQAVLKDLGRVASAHPTFGVQVVVHDATPPSAAEAASDKQRGDAAAKALVDGGANAGKVKVELAGARAPIVDPQDSRRRERNARLEVVFVAPGT